MIKYNFNGKVLNIPKKEIEKSMKMLGLNLTDAIQMWLEDEGYLENEEQENLCKLAKENKITATIHQASGDRPKKQSKPKTVKVSNEKQALFLEICEMLEQNTHFSNNPNRNWKILKENKLIQVDFNDKVFKIDLIEQRKPKK